MNFKIYSLKNVNSTNDVAIRKIKQGKLSGIITAQKQKKGRGRHGNKWVSIKGNLFVSIFYQIKKDFSIKSITLQNCLMLKKILSKFVSKKISIKAPNDLMIENKKFCGILQETFIFNDKKYIIIGIGVNISKSPNIAKYEATHLSSHNNKIDKMVVFKKIKKYYEKKLNCLKSNN